MKTLNELLKINSGLRNDAWEQEFLDTFASSKIYILDDSVQIGPDGWPYLFLSSESTDQVKAEDSVHHLLQWAYESGVGLVVNPHKERPDYVFHYGMIWNYIHNQKFLINTNSEIAENAPIYVAKVSEDIIPKQPLSFIKDYIKSAGIEEPRAALISRDKLNYDFALSIESLGNPPKDEHEGIARGIGWFLPNHIPVILIYEDKLQQLYKI